MFCQRSAWHVVQSGCGNTCIDNRNRSHMKNIFNIGQIQSKLYESNLAYIGL